MTALVLDTNIVSYLLRGDTRADPYRKHLAGKTLAISFMTIGEMYEGAYRAAWGPPKLRALSAALSKYLVVPSSNSVCDHWARIRAERRQQPISVDDAWIAATARAFGCPLVTHNAQDFAGITGLQVITEPSGPGSPPPGTP